MPKFNIVIPIEFATVPHEADHYVASRLRDVVQKAVNRYLAKALLKKMVEIGGGNHIIGMAEYQENSAEKRSERGRDAIRREYVDDIHGIAESFKEAAKAGEFDDAEGADEWLHQTVDGCQRVIYTHLAQEALLVSDNEDAYCDDFGSEGMVADGVIQWSALAFCTVKADVFASLSSDSIEVSDPDTWPVDCSKLSREACVKLLTAVSIECRDEESIETLRKAVESNLGDGTIATSDVREELETTA